MRGRDKLLENVDGEPLLRRQARAALASGCPVLVGVPPGGTGRRRALEGLDLTLIDVAEAAEGLGATLRTAAVRIAGRPMAVLLPDVPGVGAPEIAAVLAAFAEDPDRPLRAADPDGRPGTPLVVPARLMPAFARLAGDDGGKSALAGETVGLLRFPDDRATRDLDTPEDWADWRRGRG